MFCCYFVSAPEWSTVSMYNLKTSCRTEPAKMIKGQVNETEQQCVDGLLFEVVSGAGYSIPQRYLKHMARLLMQLFPETVKIMPILVY